VRNWIEDFVDEDTGELTSLERTEVLIERETIIEEFHIPIILKSNAETILYIEMILVQKTILYYSILYKKILQIINEKH